MTTSARNVLMIGVDSDTFAKIAPMLERATVEVDRFPRGRSSLELLSAVSFDALLVGFPLPDMEVEEFLAEIRKQDSLTRRTPLLLLTNEEREEEARRRFIGKGANRVVPVSTSAELLQSAVSGLLEVAPRVGARVMASLEVQLEEGKTLAMCQTENISSTGMLIRTYVGYPIGTRLSFEFALPTDGRPVRGEAEVVRHTYVDRERVRGVGARFLSFEGNGLRRFRDYLSSQSQGVREEAGRV
jgi:CheY-like chemotaxis protein